MTAASPIDHLRARAALWDELDRADGLAAQIARRVGALGIEPGRSGAHGGLTVSGNLVEELVAIDAEVVAETLSVARSRARIDDGERIRQGHGEWCRLAVRAAAATFALLAALITVSVVA